MRLKYLEELIYLPNARLTLSNGNRSRRVYWNKMSSWSKIKMLDYYVYHIDGYVVIGLGGTPYGEVMVTLKSRNWKGV